METNYLEEPVKLINLMIRLKNSFRKLWAVALALTIAVGAYSYVQGRRSFYPMYESSAIFTINAEYNSNNNIFSTNAYQDQYAAQQLAEVFPQIINSAVMRDLVLQVIPKGYINGYATSSAVADSNLLVLKVQSRDPQDACDYLNAIIDCYPQMAQYMAANPKMVIMQPPTVATEPYNTFDGSHAAIRGSVIGLLMGLALILAYALLTRTIQSVDELKTTVNLPILVALPKVTAKKRRKKAAGLITADSDPNLAESLRGLRVKVKKLLENPDQKIVLLTSTIAGEGKTTIAINLARSLVSDGHKVLMLDADLRNQSVARSLGEKASGHNLLDCLRDPDISILDLIRHNQGLQLDFISGRSADARHYTINTHALEQLLEVLTMQYDYVVVDTAPCELVSDTASLCRCADAVLYVVRQNHAQSNQILNAVTALHQKDVQLSGCVFNGVPQSQRQYGYGYGYSYGYRKYGYGYGYRKYGYGYSKYSKQGSEH